MSALTQYIQFYEANAATIDAHSPELLNRARPTALRAVTAGELPERGSEMHPALSLEQMYASDFGINVNRLRVPVDTSSSFRCGVPNVSTLLAIVAGDAFVPTDGLLRNLPEGIEVMSLAQAASRMPDLGEYYDRLAIDHGAKTDVSVALNTLLCQDGVVVRVRRGVRLDKPVQIVNIANSTMPMMTVRRMLVIMEKDTSARILVCDHSENKDVESLNSEVVEVYLGRNAALDYYQLEESSVHTARNSVMLCRQDSGSRLTVSGTTLVGGQSRNAYVIDAVGDNIDTRILGMAIANGQQVIDISTNLTHLGQGGHSEQMVKCILDDEARGSFYGTIVVDEKAKNTNAYQTNRNILASKSAKMYTRPQLEIYCEDVKCSHGATVGQLDANALFYMRQRGIPEAEARMMLMQAFMADVIDAINIPALQTRLHQLIERRLAGHADLCADCAI